MGEKGMLSIFSALITTVAFMRYVPRAVSGAARRGRGKR